MAANSHYVATKSLEEYLVNRTTGEPLAGGTVEFYKDDDRLEPKDVYQITGAPPNYTFAALPNPLTLSAVGTPQNANNDNVTIYYLPFTSDDDGADEELYYVVVKDADGNVQFTREGWPDTSGDGSGGGGGAAEGTLVNEISNPQFVDVLFNPSLGLTVNYSGADTTEVTFAPDWKIQIAHTGTGTLTLTRNNISGSSSTPTNPPYTITITPGANMTGLKIIQRLSNNPDIWVPSVSGVRGFVGGGALLGASTSITMNYVPSTGTTQTIFTASNTTGASAYFGDTVQLDPGDNIQTGATGYVDIELILSSSNPTTISSVQIIGLESNESNVAFRQDTVNRQKDQLFHYYNAQLQYKPIESWLVGWDFALNPRQFYNEAIWPIASGANSSNYLMDQTIMFQSANSGVTPSLGDGNVLRTTATAVGGSALALIQYQDAENVFEMLSRPKCVAISAKASVDVTATVSLWYTTDGSLPSTIGSQDSIVATIDSKGFPATQNGTWVQIPRSGLSNAQVTTSAVNAAQFTIETNATADFNFYQFNGWDMEGDADIANATYFAIVIGTQVLAQNAYVEWQSITCQDGYIATLPPPGLDNVAAFRYYEKSFSPAIVPAQNAGLNSGETLFPALGSATTALVNIRFVNQKPTLPAITFYNPAAANAQARNESSGADCSGTSAVNVSSSGFTISTVSNGGASIGQVLGVNWTADSRLGT